MKLMRTTVAGLMAATLSLTTLSAMAAQTITGAGSSFAGPIYSKWAAAYNKETGVQLNYQSIGSSGGIKQINASTVDFGASDKPLSDSTLAKDGLAQFPTVVGGIVVAINVPGVKPDEMVLDGKTLGDIYLGKIKKWNDPAIKALNPELNLPATDIAVVRRADGSGTSFVFTGYLSKVNSDWKSKVGQGTTVNWPVGLGGKGNDGVAAFVQRVRGAIGYVEYAYAKQNHLTYTKMKNHDGEILSPTRGNFSAAAAGADWAKTFQQDLTDKPGAHAWPITSGTFILMHTQPKDASRIKEVMKFVDFGFKHPDLAKSLDYAPLPESVVKVIHEEWSTQFKGADGKAIW
ncbi:phosphate ABC transporter substrate-binding protein PstS [Celerinatantimonas sp. MCCC 1A17872]|uniref:phosphate ABC transporter substrate-binding protein PstS n=1 Tax=Celerinatantimonas sp. MCCC 1A17872 TaxID=3177514 RepID=UPI0038BEECCF